MAEYRLGIDVGGTNTDAVILDENNNLVSSVKVPTTEDISSGILQALNNILKNKDIDKSKVNYAMLGTTHCTNAIVERRNLCKVGIIRIGSPATHGIEPMIDWPKELVDVIGSKFYIVKGGIEFDGREISPLDEDKIRDAAKEMKGKVDAVAISCVFSHIKNEHEFRAAEIIREEMGDIPISLSHEVASMGFIERENATILNSALMNVAKTITDGFTEGLAKEGIDNAEIYLCQNDGTLMSIEHTKKFPILTVACGPTNSIRGSSYLTGIGDAIIVDIGGTTTDIGAIKNQFPRESSHSIEIGDVRTNFRMPDVLTVGLGGGTIIEVSDDSIKIGPESVGYKLTEKALVFGGDILTATDIAVRLGLAEIGDPSKVEHLDREFASNVMDKIMSIIEEGVDKMKLSSEDVDVILVGGGGIIVRDKLKGASKLNKPANFPIANAIGSAISQISGDSERLFNLDEMTREEALETGKKEAIDNAILSGADENNVEVFDIEEVPLTYHPGNVIRLKIKAVGNLK